MELIQVEQIQAFVEEIQDVGSLYPTLMEDISEGEMDYTPEIGRALAVTHTKLEEALMWAEKARALADNAVAK